MVTVYALVAADSPDEKRYIGKAQGVFTVSGHRLTYFEV